MVLKLAQSHETLFALRHLTKKGSFAGMDSHVDFKVSIFCEAFFANLTLKRFGCEVSVGVDLQSSGSCVSLATDFTFIR